MWTVERLQRAHERHQVIDIREFERKRKGRMDEREARVRLYRPTGNVVPLGGRGNARVYQWPDGGDAA